ncbi:MarR family transcriptional regulator [Cardiobacteriaceae bacterium TAE3-ERU3]|nr:MarR family transcriptional regulator [Cardiobacteriaceae bacterium TAE3-ERU3]
MTSQFTLGQFLPYRLNVLAMRSSEQLARIYGGQYGITIAQWRVLVWLRVRPGASAQFIADKTFMDKATTSRAINALVERGYVSREQDSNDQRRNILALTDEGATLLGHLLPQAQAWEAQLLDVLSNEECKQLKTIMAKLEQRLGDIIVRESLHSE